MPMSSAEEVRVSSISLGAPMCPNCKVLTVRFCEKKACAAQTGRNHFECPSCFDICSEPVSYVIRPC